MRKPTKKTRTDDVFLDLGFDQAEAAARLGVSPLRVSDPVRGKWE